jgi:hypothetical protein
MPSKAFSLLMLSVLLLGLAASACSGQKTGETEISEQPPPPVSEGAAVGEQDVAPPPSQPRPAPARERAREQGIPEERPRRIVPETPPEPATITLTIPSGTSLAILNSEPVSSENAMVGDSVSARLKDPIVVDERVVFPAGSRLEGKVSDVKPAKKGFKDTGGALSISFHRLVAPNGRSAAVAAGFTKVAEGSAGKKAGIIGGSAVGGALLGKVLGKDAKGAAVIGGAIGTAVAGGTKGKEATLDAEEEIVVALEKPAKVTLNR